MTGINKLKKCSNCGSANFSTIGSPSDPQKTILAHAEKLPTGEYKTDTSMVFVVTPVVCNECDNVMLFMGE